MSGASQPDRFARSLGLLHVTASGVAVIIGAGIFVLRKTQPKLPRPFRIRGSIGWVPVVPVVGLVVVLVVSGQLERDASVLAGVVILAGAGVHWAHRWKQLRGDRTRPQNS